MAVVGYLNAELRHQFERDVDIGLGNQLALHFDFVRLPGERQGHQKGGEELAGHIAAHSDKPLAAGLPFTDVQRRIAFPAFVADSCPDLAQGIDQIADGAFVHPRHAVQMVIAAKQGQSGGERAEGSAGVAKEQIGLPLRETAAATVYGITTASMMFNADAEALQRGEHVAGIVGIEQVFNAAGVVG